MTITKFDLIYTAIFIGTTLFTNWAMFTYPQVSLFVVGGTMSLFGIFSYGIGRFEAQTEYLTKGLQLLKEWEQESKE
jgi:hypothetical protein